jgi:phage tail sheath protein FI
MMPAKALARPELTSTSPCSGRGFRLWGARTINSDPEWKYVNLRRYFAYLERSTDQGKQWAVFEPNGEQLWASVRRTSEDFLLHEWPETAFFVKCDRSTMTQDDLDHGRLVGLIGVAPLRPAEFVIFRIGQEAKFKVSGLRFKVRNACLGWQHPLASARST